MMRKLIQKYRQYADSDDGATAIEFGFVSMAFMAFVVGIYVVGFYFLTWNRLQYGTEQAARYASVHDDATTADLEEVVLDSLSIVSADPDSLEVDVGNTVINGINMTEVTSTYAFNFNYPFIPAELNNVTVESVARIAVN